MQVQPAAEVQRAVASEHAVDVEAAFAVVVDGAVVRGEVVLDDHRHEGRSAAEDVDRRALVATLRLRALSIAGGGSTAHDEAVEHGRRRAVDGHDHVVGVVFARAPSGAVVAQQVAVERRDMQVRIARCARRLVAREAAVDRHPGGQLERVFASRPRTVGAGLQPHLVAGARGRERGLQSDGCLPGVACALASWRDTPHARLRGRRGRAATGTTGAQAQGGGQRRGEAERARAAWAQRLVQVGHGRFRPGPPPILGEDGTARRLGSGGTGVCDEQSIAARKELPPRWKARAAANKARAGR